MFCIVWLIISNMEFSWFTPKLFSFSTLTHTLTLKLKWQTRNSILAILNVECTHSFFLILREFNYKSLMLLITFHFPSSHSFYIQCHSSSAYLHTSELKSSNVLCCQIWLWNFFIALFQPLATEKPIYDQVCAKHIRSFDFEMIIA